MTPYPENPSRWSERVAFAVLATIGLAISSYLAAYQLGSVAAPWDPIFGSPSSAKVLHSGLTRALPVPDAVLGAVAYAAEVVTDLAGGAHRWRTHPWLVLAFAAIAVALGLAGVALTAIQVAVVRSGCTLCLCSAAVSIAIAAAVVRGDELRAALATLSADEDGRARLPWR